jgi:hypothetical protein
MLREGAAYLGEGDFPLRIRVGHPATIMGVLKQHILNGAIRCLKLMGAGNLDQLAWLGETRRIGLL